MGNTKRSKEFLQRALNELPADFALGEVRGHLRTALRKLEHVEGKRSKRSQQTTPTPAQQWEFDVKKGLMNPFTQVGTLETVEKMIEDEQKKLEELQKKKGKSSGDEPMDTILD